MKKLLFVVMFFGFLSAQDSIKVSLTALDREILFREQEQQKFLQKMDADRIKYNYMQGAIDMLKLKRAEWDTLKTK